jgi:superfamily II DNA or RNA helicase
MNINVSKSTRQKEAVSKWKIQGCNGTLFWYPGTGKTFMTTEYIIKEIMKKPELYKNYKKPFVIIVPSLQLKEQWEDRLCDADIPVSLFRVMTVQSTYNKDNVENTLLLIIDEIHGIAGTDNYSNVINAVKSEWKLGLSGTLNDHHIEWLNSVGMAVADILTEKEALSNDWITDAEEYNVLLKMRPIEAIKMRELDKEYWEKLSILSGDGHSDFKYVGKALKADIKTINGKQVKTYPYAEMIATEKNLTVGTVLGYAIRIQKIVAERKKFYYNHPAKIEFVKAFLNKYPDRRGFIFAMETGFCDELVKQTSSDKTVSYHSNLKSLTTYEEEKIKPTKKNPEGIKKIKKTKTAKTILEETLKDFILKKFNWLVTVKKIREGTDIKNVDTVINTSYFSVDLDSIQKNARARRTEGEDKKTMVINLCMVYPDGKGRTIEQNWLTRQQKNKKAPLIVKDLNEMEWKSQTPKALESNESIRNNS